MLQHSCDALIASAVNRWLGMCTLRGNGKFPWSHSAHSTPPAHAHLWCQESCGPGSTARVSLAEAGFCSEVDDSRVSAMLGLMVSARRSCSRR